MILSVRNICRSVSYRCAQPHKELCRYAAAAGAILTADFIGREYTFNIQENEE